jgi:hypothetical protein
VKLKCLIALLSMLIAGSQSMICGENSDKDIRKQLEQDLTKKYLLIRNFYSGKNLKFDSEGKLSSKGKPGIWTVDGYFLPEHVMLSQKEIVLEGKRSYWCFDSKTKQPKMIPYSFKTTVTVARAPECNTYSAIQGLVNKVFLTSNERLEDFVPIYWKNIIRANFAVKPIDYTVRTLADGRDRSPGCNSRSSQADSRMAEIAC